jgi:endoglucanase
VSDSRPIAILADLAPITSTPFREHRLAERVAQYFRELALPLVVDAHGNLIAHYQRGRPRQSIALVAHLDHPGCEITVVESRTVARGAFLGGVRPAYFARPWPVRLIGQASSYVATIVDYETNPSTGRVSGVTIAHHGEARPGDYGMFDLPPFEEDGEDLALRAADDLVGVAAVLAAMERLAVTEYEAAVYGVLTRAEEIGLVGADALASDRTIPDHAIVISLECSPTRPGAEPGRGPVIRVGDRGLTFDPRAEAVLLAARDRLPDLATQRQLMDGGRCEALAFLRRGYATTGVAVPLTNYHNMGPDDTVLPERINRGDFLGEVTLLVEAARIAASGTPWPPSGPTIEAGLYERLNATANAFQALGGSS